ncbi:MAG: hypothetical protein R3B68_10815 [Phycisphaerales bacterium]
MPAANIAAPRASPALSGIGGAMMVPGGMARDVARKTASMPAGIIATRKRTGRSVRFVNRCQRWRGAHANEPEGTWVSRPSTMTVRVPSST